MMSFLTSLVEFAERHGVLAVIILLLLWLILILVRTLADRDKADLFRACLNRALFNITGKPQHERKYIVNDVRGRVNRARKRIHRGRGKPEKAVGVEWVADAKPESFDLRDGEFVVRLDPAVDQVDNIIAMTEVVVKRTCLTGIRNLTPAGLELALDLTMIKKLLSASGQSNALDRFFSAHYRPLEKQNPEFKNWISKVAPIDKQGLYERLLTVELRDFARRVFGHAPRPYMVDEIERMVDWVFGIATKKLRKDVRLEYCRPNVKVATVLIAKTDKILAEGIRPYQKAAEIYIFGREVHALYLIIWGKPDLRQRLRGWERRYARLCDDLHFWVVSQKGVYEDFRETYSYVDPNGYVRQGEIVRFVNTNAAA